MYIDDKTVEELMGPDPIPTLDIEMSEITNELQIKIIEEIRCIKCQKFPYSPKECRNCNKIICKKCQKETNKCPNCKKQGEFQSLNKVLLNIIDYFKYPHRCFKQNKEGEIIWKTMKEWQEHAKNDCPNVRCDICKHEDF